MREILNGKDGGAWDEEAHRKLHPDNFNFGLAKYITEIIAPSDMLEFGSGLGYLSKYVVDKGCVSESICIEPNEIVGVYENSDKGPRLLSLDIFNDVHPQAINKKFDLVMSIEVAEHIDRKWHNELFDFLVSHTSNWVVFSGARIGQGGHGHISERDEEDWKFEFVKRGLFFEEDMTRKVRLACDEKNINHRQNLMIFRRKEGHEDVE